MNATFFFIRANRKCERIELPQLIYVESCRGYLKLVTDSKTWFVHATMLNLEKVLPTGQFVRIHRSYIIALDRVLSFDKAHVTIRTAGGEKLRLEISQRQYKDALYEKVTVIGDEADIVPLSVTAMVVVN
jgi:DNA-binding LytR/AlgR family response regulator